MLANILALFTVVCGEKLPPEEDGRARRVQLIAVAALALLFCAALWGLAAGSHSPALMLGNLYKVPMVVLLSSISAVSAGMLAWRLLGVCYSGTTLLLGFAASVFGGTLVLGVLAPLVAIDYPTSTWAGPFLGIGSVVASIVVAAALFVRNVLCRAPLGTSRKPLLEGLHRVTIRAADGRTFRPDPALGLVQRIGRFTAPDIGRKERRLLDERLRTLPDGTGLERLYLRVGPPVAKRGGIAGVLEAPSAKRRGVALGAGVVFGAALAGCVVLLRRAGQKAELERVDALLEAEYRELLSDAAGRER